MTEGSMHFRKSSIDEFDKQLITDDVSYMMFRRYNLPHARVQFIVPYASSLYSKVKCKVVPVL
jgi:hypothetical protein